MADLGSGGTLGPIIVTAREIYDAVVILNRSVERLVDQNIEMSGDVRDHEERIRSLERSRWPLPSLSAILAVAAMVITVIQFLRG